MTAEEGSGRHSSGSFYTENRCAAAGEQGRVARRFLKMIRGSGAQVIGGRGQRRWLRQGGGSPPADWGCPGNRLGWESQPCGRGAASFAPSAGPTSRRFKEAIFIARRRFGPGLLLSGS